MTSRASVLLQLWATPKTIVLSVLALGLVGVLSFATMRELGRAATPAPVVPEPARPTRPALTAAEEAFIRTMTPIHSDVQRSLMRASLGQILYKTNDLSANELQTRMTQALATYGRAEIGLRALEPPSSLVRDHERYIAAVLLLQESAVEGLKMFKDGKDAHLLAAYPKSQEASELIREVGVKFWPDEFPPN